MRRNEDWAEKDKEKVFDISTNRVVAGLLFIISCAESEGMLLTCAQIEESISQKSKTATWKNNPIFDDIEDDCEKQVDLIPLQAEDLVVRRILASSKSQEKEGWRCKSLFRTCVLCSGKACKVIVNGRSSKICLKISR